MILAECFSCCEELKGQRSESLFDLALLFKAWPHTGLVTAMLCPLAPYVQHYPVQRETNPVIIILSKQDWRINSVICDKLCTRCVLTVWRLLLISHSQWLFDFHFIIQKWRLNYTVFFFSWSKSNEWHLKKIKKNKKNPSSTDFIIFNCH